MRSTRGSMGLSTDPMPDLSYYNSLNRNAQYHDLLRPSHTSIARNAHACCPGNTSQPNNHRSIKAVCSSYQVDLRKEEVLQHRRGGELGIEEHAAASSARLRSINCTYLRKYCSPCLRLSRKRRSNRTVKSQKRPLFVRPTDQRQISAGVSAGRPRSLGTCGAGRRAGCRTPSTLNP
jgi:hypothetical protein